MDIGKPKRVYTVEPAEDPLRRRHEQPTREPEPVREPAPKPAPEKEPVKV